jgi:hypothetical protein
MKQIISEVGGGTRFSRKGEKFVRLSPIQWVHALQDGADITPNALRIRDGTLVAIPADAELLVRVQRVASAKQ